MTAEPLSESDNVERYGEVARFIRDHRHDSHLYLVSPGGEQLELPDRHADLLAEAAGILTSGETVSVVSTEILLTISQAAEILGVSRPALMRQLDQGEISYALPGRHRRLRLTDLLAYREEQHRRQEALEGMVKVSVEAGLYEALEEGEEDRT